MLKWIRTACSQQNRATCRATLLRCKLQSNVSRITTVRATCRAINTLRVVGCKMLLHKVEAVSTSCNKVLQPATQKI